ncbi:MAG: HAD family hydrolase [Bacillota bacterium]
MEKAIIFDFDDTLVYTNDIFNNAKDRFYDLMFELNLADERLADVLNHLDIANVKKAGGLAKDCFPNALRQTYLYYCRKKNQQADLKIAELCADIGWQVYEITPVIVPGAEELLKELSAHYKLYMMTQGDKKTQKERMEKSGLLRYFDDYKIVKAKKQFHYMQLITKKSIKKEASWSVGNSLRSDINPALLAGLKAIHVQVDCWDYESAASIGGYHQTKDLLSCRNILLDNIPHDKEVIL